MDNKTLTRAFLDAGWKQQEAKFYLLLLELGEQAASVIASKSQKNRITTYHALERMVEKGWLSKRKAVHGYAYSCNNPHDILSNLEQSRNAALRKLGKEVELFSDLIPHLESINKSVFKKPIVETFYGEQALHQIYKISLDTTEMFVLYEAWISEEYPELVEVDNWHTEQRIQKKIPVKIILPNTRIAKAYANISKPLKQVKLVNDASFSFKDITIITDTHVLIYSLADRMGVSIQSPSIAMNQKKQFNLMWSLL